MLYPPSIIHQAEPCQWVNDVLKIRLWSKERDIIESVRDNRQTAVHTCHDIGKSLTAAAAALWWITTHPLGEAFVVTTAPTFAQVAAILWREMNKLHTRAGLGGRMNLLEWYFGNEMVAFGRKPADYDPDAFQGIHARYVLVIFDEACGIPKALWDSASTLVANEGSRFLAIGNPDDPHGEFSRVCKPNSGWHVIHVGYEHTPNFTGEIVDPIVSDSTISRAWVEDRAKSWGKTSALYTSKVLGLFPTDADKGVIPHSWATQCRYLELPAVGIRAAGLDVGGGGDRTVLQERVGPRAGRCAVWVESDPMKAVGQIVEKLREWDIERVVVDVIGIGWGLAGRLAELSTKMNHGFAVDADAWGTHAAEVVHFNGASASTEPERFINRRAELHWMGRELCRLKQWDLTGIDDDTLQEMTEPEYEIMDSRGKIKVEAKENVIHRLGRSPDRSDALLMSYWDKDSVEANFPAPANILTGVNYNDVLIEQGPGWHGPRPGPTDEEISAARQLEEEIMRELLLGRPV
jgi:hypothetical protein